MKYATRRRIFLIAALLLIIAIVGDLILIPAFRYRLQRGIAEQVESNGGIVNVRYTGPRSLLRIASDRCREKYVESSSLSPVLPATVRDGLSYTGIDAFVRVHDVADAIWLDDYFFKSKNIPAMLDLLPRLSTIRAVHFRYMHARQREKPDWSKLSQLTNLQTVSFQIDSSIDETFAALANCKTLRRIHVFSWSETNSDNLASDAGLTHLSGLNQLQELKIRGVKVTDACLPTLKKFTQLESIDLSQTSVSEEGLGELQRAIPGIKASLGTEPGLHSNGEAGVSDFVGFDRLPGGFF